MRKIGILSALIAAAAFAVPKWARPSPESDLRQAQAVLEQAIKEHPQNAELYVHLGFVYRKLDKIDDAQKAFEQAVRVDPSKAEAFYMLGLIYEKKGLSSQAQQAWQSCLKAATDQGMKDTATQHLHILQSTRH